MIYSPGDSVVFDDSTFAQTGATTPADSLPTAVIRRNGVVDNSVTVTVSYSNPQYDYSFSIPPTYSNNDVVEVVVTAIVGGVSATQTLWRERLLVYGGAPPSVAISQANYTSGTSVYASVASLITKHGAMNIQRWSNPDNIGTLSLTSLTQTGGNATALCLGPQGFSPGFIAGDTISIQGASPAGYNGTGLQVTQSLSNGFNYAVNASLSSASGNPTVTMVLATGRINYWLLQADAAINSIMLAGQIFISQGGYITGGPVALSLCNKWAVSMTAWWLYEGARGLVDGDSMGMRLKADYDRAGIEARQCAADKGSPMNFDASRRWPMGNAVQGYAPCPQNAWSLGSIGGLNGLNRNW